MAIKFSVYSVVSCLYYWVLICCHFPLLFNGLCILMSLLHIDILSFFIVF
ncbi:hypothetical protein BVRB_5g114510 [Beta vulgaris subsp. vulgaris]|nr:hypothetical protein BVRB_5g114510 [Beta vulgaris subsp. vulgaris]